MKKIVVKEFELDSMATMNLLKTFKQKRRNVLEKLDPANLPEKKVIKERCFAYSRAGQAANKKIKVNQDRSLNYTFQNDKSKKLLAVFDGHGKISLS